VIEAVIGRFTGLIDEVMRCIATDLDPAAVESADMDSRGMVVELVMLDSPESLVASMFFLRTPAFLRRRKPTPPL
jgi:hypothetical protein